MTSRCRAAALCLSLSVAPLVHAADVKVLSAGAVEPGLRATVQRYEQASGDTVTITFAAAPALRDKAATPAAAAAAGFDVLIAPSAVLDTVAGTGTVRSDRVPLGRVGIGVAVRPGAPKPDLSTPETLKAALLAADAVVYNRASTGQHIERVVQREGLDAALAGKTIRVADGVAVVQRLLQGQGRELGFAAITEIVLQKESGLVYVGAVPGPWQNRTLYQAVAASRPSDEAAALRLLQHLASDDTKAAMRAAGID